MVKGRLKSVPSVFSDGLGQFQEVFAVVTHFLDAFENIVQSLMRTALYHAFGNGRIPTFGEFFQGGYVQIAVVEIRFEARHIFDHEAAVLMDGIAAHRRGFFGNPLRDKVEQFLFHVGFGQLRFAHALGQPRAAVGGSVPCVHAVEQFVALVDDINFGLRQDVQIGVGDNHGDFDDAFALGVKPGHFHIEPAEVACVLSHFRRPFVGLKQWAVL